MANAEAPNPLHDHFSTTGLVPTSNIDRLPSPPPVLVPPPAYNGASETAATVSLQQPDLAWAYASVLGLTEEQYLFIIDNNKVQGSYVNTSDWTYTERHKAHQILDFLWLGPASVARNPGYLATAEITMLMAVRDARFPNSFQGAIVAAHAAGVATHSVLVDTQGPGYGLQSIQADVAESINNHMLAVARDTGRRGKVLVVCETGNDRSVLIVVGYLMALYGVSFIDAARFVQSQRFCISIADPHRHALKSLGEVLRARVDVVVANGLGGSGSGSWSGAARSSREKPSFVSSRTSNKRSASDSDDEVPREGNAPYQEYEDSAMG